MKPKRLNQKSLYTFTNILKEKERMSGPCKSMLFLWIRKFSVLSDFHENGSNFSKDKR